MTTAREIPEGMDSEDWKAHNKQCRAERSERNARRREEAPAALIEAGIAFVAHNGGAHIVIGQRFDFWPGTLRWADRVTKRTGHGTASLIVAVRAAGKP
jgi:hypothetical protein